MGFVPDPSTTKKRTAFKNVLLNNASCGLHSLLGPHTEVTEPSELAERGNQNRRAQLMPRGRKEGWTNTNLLNIVSLIG